MFVDLPGAEHKARRFLNDPRPLRRLGWGIGGVVFLSHDSRTAVKILHRREQYVAECFSYRTFAARRIRGVCGLTIPQLRGFNHELRAVHMDAVDPPYLLDFAGAQFKPPDFNRDVIAHWRKGIETTYGANASIAYEVYATLAKIGIYYMDFRLSNMRLDGLPGLKPDVPHDEEADDGYWH